MRNFEVKYGNWAVTKAAVDPKLLEGADAITIVRRAMGHAFMQQLKGDWPEHDDCKVELIKSNPGVYIGQRHHPKSGNKPDPFYILEV